MSNVLIGIIGVILFIGLALAGALFLGPQFQQSTANSRAAAVTQSAAQISSAANLGNVQTGTLFQTGNTINDLQTAGLLKEVPVNPVFTAGTFRLGRESTMVANTAGQADIVVASIGPSSQTICDAIERQAGGTTAPAVSNQATLDAAIVRVVGCFRTTVALTMAGAAANDYVVYSKI